jgi:V/A-type H+-transporting ATPase subunit I
VKQCGLAVALAMPARVTHIRRICGSVYYPSKAVVMKLRPSPAHWFEVVVPKGDADDTMEALARIGQVQFEWKGDQVDTAKFGTLRRCIERYRALAADHAELWPQPVFEKRCCLQPVEESARDALDRIEQWRSQAERRLERLQSLRRQRTDLLLWQPVLEALDGTGPDLAALAGAGPTLGAICIRLEPTQDVSLPQLLLRQELQVEGRRVLLGLAPCEALQDLCGSVSSSGGVCLDLPDWFEPGPDACRVRLAERREALEQRIRVLEDQLRRLAEQHQIDGSTGVLERIDWFCRNAEHIRCDRDSCWITGWTSESDVGAMNRALQEVGVQGTLSLRPPPADAAIPSLTHSPVWLTPFEVFTRAIGVPGVTEADPTTWVALLVPVMFGYMCGDVGHGAVIFCAGLLLRSRTRLWPLLVFAGLAATVFGFVYGEIFGYEHLIEPLWLRPIEEPFIVLMVPIAVGALVLNVGVLLHVVGTCWRGEGRSKGVADAAQLLVYWGIILAFVDLRLGWLAVAGTLLCGVNRLWMERSPMALLSGLGNLFQSSFELLLNTLSFVRVGAFALAHAALQSAVLALADAVNPVAAVVVIVLGNLAVIVVEGVVVSIQTTRLVLFEFFIQFFQGEGREFRPADRPPESRQQESSGEPRGP